MVDDECPAAAAHLAGLLFISAQSASIFSKESSRMRPACGLSCDSRETARLLAGVTGLELARGSCETLYNLPVSARSRLLLMKPPCSTAGKISTTDGNRRDDSMSLM